MNSQERYFPKAELESNDMRHIAVPETAHYSGLTKFSDEKLLLCLVIKNKKDMKPFHIDRELECPILFHNVLILF